MATLVSLARVNAGLLKKHIDKRVLLIGRLDSQEGSEARFQASDGVVNAHIGSALGELKIGAVYQILGQVTDDTSVKAFQVLDLKTTELPPAEFERRVYEMREGPAKHDIFAPQ